MVRAPLHFHGRIPVPEVAPLTYRDGVSQLELVYELSQYLKNILHPSLQSTVDQVVADSEKLLSDATAQYIDGVEEFQRIHDAFMSDVHGALTALNDTAVSDLVDDTTSLLSQTLYRVFADRESLYRVAVDASEFGATPNSPDSTDTIQVALDYAHEHNINRVIVGGTHRIRAHDDDGRDQHAMYYRGGVVVHSGITLDLQHARLEAIPNDHNNYNIIRIEDAENVTIQGGEIVGERHEHTGSSGTHGFGVNIRGSRNVVIDSTVFRDFWGDGIYVAAETDHHNTDVLIRNVTCTGNRRQGMTIVGGRNIVVENSTFTKTGGALPQAGVDIEPNHVETVCENITFRDCHFTDNDGAGLYLMGSNIRNVVIDGCTVAGNHADYNDNGQLRITRGPQNVTINATTVEDNQGSSPLDLDIQSTNTKISNSRFQGRVLVSNPFRDTSSEVVIENSTLEDNVRLGSGPDLTVKIRGNDIHTTTNVPFTMYAPSGITAIFEGNIYHPTTITPFIISPGGSPTLAVKNNVFLGYPNNAIRVLLNGGNSVFQGNQFHGSQQSQAAIYLNQGSRNVIVSDNNHVTDHDDALLRCSSTHHNLQVQNNNSPDLMRQFPSSTSTNTWIELTPLEWWHNGQTITLGSS